MRHHVLTRQRPALGQLTSQPRQLSELQGRSCELAIVESMNSGKPIRESMHVDDSEAALVGLRVQRVSSAARR